MKQNMRQYLRNSLLALLLVLAPVAWAEEGEVSNLYVQSNGAALMEAPAFDGDPLRRLERGREVELLENAGNWLRVRVDELEGWLPALVLREQPPTRRDSHLDQAEEMDASARRRASAVTTAGAIRGVEEDERLLDDPNLDVEALHRLEEMGVSREEAIEFLLSEDEEEEAQ